MNTNSVYAENNGFPGRAMAQGKRKLAVALIGLAGLTASSAIA